MHKSGAYSGVFRFVVALSVAFAPVLAQSTVRGQDVCQDYTEWLRTHPTGEADPTAEYRKDLIRRGMSAEQAGARLEALWKSMVRCPQGSGLSFDRVYRWQKIPFTTEPNAFLVETTRTMRPGRALDVSMGQGRNSIYLAKKGWDVTGFDVSSEGLAMAEKAAEEAGVRIRMVHQGWEEFDFGSESWDLILLTYPWVPIGDPAFVRRLCSSLRPGGFVVFEAALVDSRAPVGVHPNEVMKAFQNDLRILRYEEIEAVADWDNRKKENLVRMMARK